MACIFYNMPYVFFDMPYVFFDMPKRLKNYRDTGRENEYILQDTKQKKGHSLTGSPQAFILKMFAANYLSSVQMLTRFQSGSLNMFPTP